MNFRSNRKYNTNVSFHNPRFASRIKNVNEDVDQIYRLDFVHQWDEVSLLYIVNGSDEWES